MPDGLICEHARLIARTLRAKQRHKSRLPRRMNLANRFSGRFRISFGIDKVIGNLECEAEIMRISPEGLTRGFGRVAKDGSRFAGIGDQFSRLQTLQTRDSAEIKF